MTKPVETWTDDTKRPPTLAEVEEAGREAYLEHVAWLSSKPLEHGAVRHRSSQGTYSVNVPPAADYDRQPGESWIAAQRRAGREHQAWQKAVRERPAMGEYAARRLDAEEERDFVRQHVAMYYQQPLDHNHERRYVPPDHECWVCDRKRSKWRRGLDQEYQQMLALETPESKRRVTADFGHALNLWSLRRLGMTADYYRENYIERRIPEDEVQARRTAPPQVGPLTRMTHRASRRLLGVNVEPGDKVWLRSSSDPDCPRLYQTGTVEMIDGHGTIHVKWGKKGQMYGLLIGRDKFDVDTSPRRDPTAARPWVDDRGRPLKADQSIVTTRGVKRGPAGEPAVPAGRRGKILGLHQEKGKVLVDWGDGRFVRYLAYGEDGFVVTDPLPGPHSHTDDDPQWPGACPECDRMRPPVPDELDPLKDRTRRQVTPAPVRTSRASAGARWHGVMVVVLAIMFGLVDGGPGVAFAVLLTILVTGAAVLLTGRAAWPIRTRMGGAAAIGAAVTGYVVVGLLLGP